MTTESTGPDLFSRPLEALSCTLQDHIATVTLAGPGKGNAMGPALFREVPLAFGALDGDARVRAVIVRGKGEHFSYGLDLPAMAMTLGPLLRAQEAKERMRLLDVITELQRSFDAVATCRKPVICAVAGYCIGGGLDLAAACDVRICASDAKFSLREVKVAMVADLGSLQRLPAIVGEGNARELALTGKTIDATRARSMGLVNELFATHDELYAGAQQLGKEIAENPPLVVEGVKRVMLEAMEKRVRDGLRHVALWNSAFIGTSDLEEALRAFLERRPPVFQGK